MSGVSYAGATGIRAWDMQVTGTLTLVNVKVCVRNTEKKFPAR